MKKGIVITGVDKYGNFLHNGERIKVKTDGTFKKIRIGDIEFRNVVADSEEVAMKLSNFVPDNEDGK